MVACRTKLNALSLPFVLAQSVRLQRWLHRSSVVRSQIADAVPYCSRRPDWSDEARSSHSEKKERASGSELVRRRKDSETRGWSIVRTRPTDRIATWNEAFGWDDDGSRRMGSAASALIEVALIGPKKRTPCCEVLL